MILVPLDVVVKWTIVGFLCLGVLMNLARTARGAMRFDLASMTMTTLIIVGIITLWRTSC